MFTSIHVGKSTHSRDSNEGILHVWCFYSSRVSVDGVVFVDLTTCYSGSVIGMNGRNAARSGSQRCRSTTSRMLTRRPPNPATHPTSNNADHDWAKARSRFIAPDDAGRSECPQWVESCHYDAGSRPPPHVGPSDGRAGPKTG